MKKIIIGMIIGLVLSLGTTTFANTDVLAKIFNIKLKVNGVEKQLNSKSYNIDGSTYVPLREISNITGYDVTYKADLQTIELNNNNNITTTLQSNNVTENTLNELPDEGKDFTVPEIQHNIPSDKVKNKHDDKILGQELVKNHGFKMITSNNLMTIYHNEQEIAKIDTNLLLENKEVNFNYKNKTIIVTIDNGILYFSKNVLD